MSEERRVGETRSGLVPQRHQVQAVIAPVRDVAILGGFGSGKSTAGMWRFKRHCGLNGIDRRPKGRLQKVPKAAIVAPTYKNLEGAVRDTFDAVFPAEWIRHRKGAPRPYVELVNGVVIELHSGPTLEGSNYFAILVDEIQHRAYSDRQWTNFAARPRDREAVTLTETYTGLPEEGRVRGRFDREPQARALDGTHGGHWTILCSTHDNRELPLEVKAAILASVAGTDTDRLIRGQWMQPQGAVFPGYDSAAHVRREAIGDRSTPVHIGLDPGPKATAVLGQLHQIKALLPQQFGQPDRLTYDDLALRIVGQVLTEGEGVEGVCRAIIASGWPIVPGVSVIYHDPSASVSIDDERTLRRYFPGVKILAASIEAGAAEERVKIVNRALRDALGTIRLTFSPALSGARRGVLEVLAGDARTPSGELRGDDVLEHSRDALGYLVEGVLPRPYRRANLADEKPRAMRRR